MQLWLKACALGLLMQHGMSNIFPSFQYSHLRRNMLEGHSLRILPPGASITNGEGSSHRNGYRKHLRDALRYAQAEVDMVGSKRDGTNFNDDDNEGHGGFTIKRVYDMVKAQYRVKPNLVLINAGTNNCVRENSNAYASGKQQMKAMVIDIFDNIPEVTVILSGLLPQRDVGACTEFLNFEYAKIVDELAGEGRKVIFADFHTRWITLDEIPDGTHPNDSGYKKTAGIWFDAI
ncbi:SGNH hydrolase-type esterase domain-containing protein [Aspergillus multicolor]|uniref:SGNH hydrolase-type esterase domain-containing protein n=1 Tax=Aspergillus multicolor TaxID=41759 RepID=UPI003CCDA71D